jgi:hypothetical protein
MFRNRFLIAVYFVLVSFCSTSVQAQDDLSRIRGLAKDELIALIGQPGRASAPNPRTNSETLFYGSSQVLLVNGIVASWSDTGELRTRLQHFAPHKKDTWEKWPNPWTPPG